MGKVEVVIPQFRLVRDVSKPDVELHSYLPDSPFLLAKLYGQSMVYSGQKRLGVLHAEDDE